jgi:hypothetical protein
MPSNALASKLALRRWLLGRLGWTDVRVLDTGAGFGAVWEAMGEHVDVRQWTRCWEKATGAGSLAMAALEGLSQLDLSLYNVIDIDTGGDPHAAYLTALPRLTTPTAVFLNHRTSSRSRASGGLLAALGIPAEWPVHLTPALSSFAMDCTLARTHATADVLLAAKACRTYATDYGLVVMPRSDQA